MSALVRVPFHGDEIECVRDERGVWVSLRRMCETLGIDVEGQRRKLAGKPWAVAEMKSATGPDGKSYEVSCLHLDSVAMWLATIEPSRVADAVRSKLTEYQCEAAKALHAHFFEPRPSTAIDHTVIATIAAAVAREVVSTLRRDDQERALLAQTVGRSGHKVIRDAITALAGSQAPRSVDARQNKRVRAGIETNLRARMLWSGPGRSWAAFPMQRWAEMLVEVETMRRDAARLAPSPQLSIVPSAGTGGQ